MSKKLAWFDEGVRFGCTKCGKCCTGAPGYVWLTSEDIDTLVNHLQIPREEFFKKYTRYINGRYSLQENSTTFDCIFLKGKECTVYEARPKQCRKFPFWPENLTSKKAWDQCATYCEGINHKDAPLIPLSKIQELLQD